MKKIALDTNILLRYFLDELSSNENSTLEQLLFVNDCKIYIDILVISELIFVMNKTYKKSRQTVFEIIQILLLSKNTVFDKAIISKCMDTYLVNNTIGFVDIMTSLSASRNGYSPLYTFDQALQKFDPLNIKSLSSRRK